MARDTRKGLIMDCTVENCEESATHRFVWAWGEEGACCDRHRAELEGKSQQLGRSISFSAASDTDRPPPGRKPYNPPTLQRLDPELGKLRLQLAEAQAQIATLEQTIEARDAQLVELQRQHKVLLRGGEPEPPPLHVVEGATEPTGSAEPPRAATSQPTEPQPPRSRGRGT